MLNRRLIKQIFVNNYGRALTTHRNVDAQAVEKLSSLPVRIDKSLLNKNTLDRLEACSGQFLADMVKCLSQNGMNDKHIANCLNTHDDWSLLASRARLADVWSTFRELSLKPAVYLHLFATNAQIVRVEKRLLKKRLVDLKEYFANKYLERLLVRSPHVLTDNFDVFRYKFTYVYALMGKRQDEMSSCRMFDHSIEFIRERHLFLERSGFYDRPNKKNISKVENAKLKTIVDSPLDDYLRHCTRGMFTSVDYATFCAYLQTEQFDNELLASRIDKILQKQIIDNIRINKRSSFIDDDYDDDNT